MNGTFTKKDLAEVIKLARLEKGLSWTQIADYIGKDRVWTVAALLGQHPLSASDASTVATLLDLGDEAISILKMLPYRGSDEPTRDDPTIYRFHEALTVYGPAIKELIHEEFGDGIMSAVNFRVTIERRRHFRREVPRLRMGAHRAGEPDMTSAAGTNGTILDSQLLADIGAHAAALDRGDDSSRRSFAALGAARCARPGRSGQR